MYTYDEWRKSYLDKARTVIKILKVNESIIRLKAEKSNYLYSEKEISSDTIKLLI